MRIELPPPKYYTLIERKVVSTSDVVQWAQWMELARREDVLRIGRDEIGGALVSTVFLGLDHSFCMGSGPLLFETMVFMQADDGSSDTAQWRYITIDEAEAGHLAVCESLRRHEKDAIRKARELLALVRSEISGRR